jgi:hypothetical protein
VVNILLIKKVRATCAGSRVCKCSYSRRCEGSPVVRKPSAYRDSNYKNFLFVESILLYVTVSFPWYRRSSESGTLDLVRPDNCNYNASGVVLHVGGNYNQNLNHGLFHLNGNNAASNSNGNIGCRQLVNNP